MNKYMMTTNNGGSNVEIPPLGAHLITFETAELPKNMIFLSTVFRPIATPIPWQLPHFESAEIGPKWSDFDVWPTVGCARIRVFQRILNQRSTIELRAPDLLFLEMEAKCVHKVSEYGLYVHTFRTTQFFLLAVARFSFCSQIYSNQYF